MTIPRRLPSALGLLAATLAAALAGGCDGPPPPPAAHAATQADGPATEPRRPNVLVVVIDCLRADRLGANGYPWAITPHIDALAAEGVYFTEALSQATWTKPSIGTLITSRYPSEHKLTKVAVVDGGELASPVLDQRFVTLAEAFQDAGYTTLSSVNQVHLKRKFGFAQGYDYYWASTGQNAYPVQARLLNWLQKLEDEGQLAAKPFFAYLHTTDAHWPYTLSHPDGRGSVGPRGFERPPPRRQEGRLEQWMAEGVSDNDLLALQVRYDEEIAATDTALRHFDEELQRRGLFDETIVVVTADHGEAMLEHGELTHGYLPHDELIRVPLVIRLPMRMRPAPGPRRGQVGLIDLMPTLLALTGIVPPPGLRGIDLADRIAGAPPVPRLMYAESEKAVALRSRTYKLMQYADGRQELYDLARDPGEKRPYGPPLPPVGRQMAAELGELLASLRTTAEPKMKAIGPDEQEQLRSLGYLQ